MGWGFLGDIADAACDAVSDVGSAVADVASDVGQGVADAAVAVGEAAVDVAGNAGGYVGDGIGFLGSAVDTATFGGASAILNAVDDTVLDGVDYVTDGVVDIDFDDGRFSASVGIDGVADVGASIGEDGITASADSVLASTDVGLTDQGLQFDSSGGIDFGPLPYYNGHVDVSPDGDVSINGHIQGTVPTPYGLLSGHADGGFVRTDQGWGTYVDADGTLLLPSGTSIAAGVQAGYMESGGNSQTTFGAHGSVSEPGVGTIGGSFGYQSTTKDGVTVTTQTAEAHASGFGAQVQASEAYVGIDTPQGSVSQTTTDFDASGPSIDAVEHLTESVFGDDDITSPTGAAAAAITTPGAADAAAPASPASPASQFDDDVLGGTPAATPAQPAVAEDDVSGMGTPADASAPAPSEPTYDDPAAAAPVDAPADAPAETFDTRIESIDQVDTSTDAFFDDLT